MRNGRRMPSVHAILQSGNLYMFTMHNPVRWVDPSGLFAITPIGMGGIFGPTPSAIIISPLLVSIKNPKKMQVDGGVGGGTTVRWANAGASTRTFPDPATRPTNASINNTGAVRTTTPTTTASQVTTPATTPITINQSSVRTATTNHFLQQPGATANTGRGANHLRHNPNATGPHFTYRVNSAGSVTNIAEWTPNPKNPTGYDLAKRIDVTGRAHPNSVTGQSVPTPHVHGTSVNPVVGGVRPAEFHDIPSWATDMATPIKI